jgi:hypothetical protein
MREPNRERESPPLNVPKRARISPTKSGMRSLHEEFNEAVGGTTWRKKGGKEGFLSSPTTRKETGGFGGPMLAHVETNVQVAKIAGKGTFNTPMTVEGEGKAEKKKKKKQARRTKGGTLYAFDYARKKET